jgi:glycosyltransferase involved in cell wall biosynthesis
VEKDALQPLPSSPLEDLSKTESFTSSPHQPLRLSIVTQFYPPDYAATGQLIEELAGQLGKLGVQVQIFTGQPAYAYFKQSAPAIETAKSLVVQRSSTSRFWSRRIRGRAVNGLLFCLRSGMHLLKQARQSDVLLLTTEPPYLTVLGYLVHRLFQVPYVCLLYDLYPDVAVQLKVLPMHHWLVRFWDWLNCRIWQQAQSIVVLSSTMKARIAAKCPAIAHKITVIHNWADPNLIQPVDKQDNWFAHQHDLVEKFTVLYSGNMGRCHDIDTILAAAAHLKQKPIQFVFIGGGAKRWQCMEKAIELGLDNCRFLPYQNKAILPYSLTACDLALVSVSPGMEGLIAPSKLYSVLATGRPVAAICESHSYLKQLLSEANCGEAFENGDATGLADFIDRLAKNPLLAKALGTAGRHYLQSHFTPEIIANQYFQVLTTTRYISSPPRQDIPTKQETGKF